MARDMIILVNKGEQTNVFADHLRVAQKAFPDARTCVWQGSPPSLKDEVVLRVGNTFFLGSEQFANLEKRLKEARTVFTITNDYTSAPPTQVRRAMRHLVAKGRKVVALTTVPTLDTMKNWKGVWYSDSEYVDWNRASYQRRPTETPGDKGGLIYWGALRPDRVPSFDRYFMTKKYVVSLSGAHRSRAKWMERYPRATWQGRLSLDECASWTATVYIEDECQHGEYHSVASRFYEAVGRGMLVLVDASAKGTFEEADIDVRRWIVKGDGDVEHALLNWGRLRSLQQKTLVRDYTEDVVKQLRAAVKRHA